jgi:hypothetical protein
MLETNQALGNMDHTFVSELEEGMWLIVLFLFCTLHLVFVLGGLLCVCEVVKVKGIF